MRVSILIISYNTAEMTVAAVRSVLDQTRDIDFEIIVVDNASADNSVELLESQFPEVRLIKLKKNIGFAAANNLASEEAVGEYLLLLNPDTLIIDSAIDRIFLYSENQLNWGILGGSTFFVDGSRNPTSGWMKTTIWSMLCYAIGLSKVFPNSRLFNPESLVGCIWDGVMSVDIVTGCFLLINREHWIALNGFNEAFFMYGEDADLCLRAKEMGLKIMILPDVKIIHYGGASEPRKADKMIRLYKSKVQLFKRHYSKINTCILIFLLKYTCVNRIVQLGIVGVIKKEFKDRKNVWVDIWIKRNEWLA